MAKHRSHSVEFKRQVAQEFLAGETLHGRAKRHDVSRNLIRIWVQKYETGAFDEEALAADLIQEYEARIAALERLVAVCFKGAEDLDRWMVSTGWAVAYREYSLDYVAGEESAKRAKLGIWSGGSAMPWDWRARGTKH